MNLKSLLVIFLILSSKYGYSQYTYKQNLGGLGSVALPVKPEIKEIKGLKIYVARYNHVGFVAQAQDIHGGLKDLFKSTSLDKVYASFVNGAIGSSKGKLLYKNNILINGNKALEFGYKAKPVNQDIYTYVRVVSLNDSLLMTGIVASDSLPHNHPALDTFFKGFSVIDKEELGLRNAENLGRKTGHALGVVIILGILLGIVLAIVFLIRKIAYRNKS